MVLETSRKIKAILFIIMLFIEEVRLVLADARLNGNSHLRSHGSASSRGDTGADSGAHLGEMLPGPILLEQMKAIYDQLEAIMIGPSFETSAKAVSKAIASMMADPTLQDEAILTDKSFREQAKRVGNQIQEMSADQRIQEQAQTIAKALTSDSNFKKQAKLVSEGLGILMADPSFQQNARSIVKQVEHVYHEADICLDTAFKAWRTPQRDAQNTTLENFTNVQDSKENCVNTLVNNAADKMYELVFKVTTHFSPHRGGPKPLTFSSFALSNRPRLRRDGFAVRAGSELSDRIARAGAAVDQLPPAERKAVEAATMKLGRRVTVGDVAAEAGVPLKAAENALNALTLDSQGSIEVSSRGDIVYNLPSDFLSRVAAKSLQTRIDPAIEKLGAVLSYVARVGFGTCLITSVVVVVSACFVIAAASQQVGKDERRSDDRNAAFDAITYNAYRSNFIFGPRFYISPFDFFYYWDPRYYQKQRRMVSEGNMGFLPAIFSFVFGDGSPNAGLEKRRWEAVAAAIVQRNGVIAAEELAPFLDGPGAGEPSQEEGYILEALQRFDGEPMLDNDGRLVYRFQALMTSAGGGADDRRPLSPYLVENPWKFSGAAGDQKAAVVALGAINLLGILVLNSQLANPRNLYIFYRTTPNFANFVVRFLPFLNGYAAFIIVFPLLRLIRNILRNRDIEARNKRRFQSAERLRLPDPALKTKLRAVRAAAQAQPVRREVRKSDIAFDSSAQLENSHGALDDFDKRLAERGY